MIRNPADSNFTGLPICRRGLASGSPSPGVSPALAVRPELWHPSGSGLGDGIPFLRSRPFPRPWVIKIDDQGRSAAENKLPFLRAVIHLTEAASYTRRRKYPQLQR